MSNPGPEVDRLLAETVRLEGARILATLVRTVGDLSVAEDAVQEATLRALRDWPRTGVPDQPRAWLTTVARRAAVDHLRRETARSGKERASAMSTEPTDPVDEGVVDDDRLRLLFTCCHPALALDARVTLALRTLCGLTPAQIAGVLLSSEAAIAKRLTRTRTKIARAGIPYVVPEDTDLPDRVSAVCAVLHALYTTAHTSTDDPEHPPREAAPATEAPPPTSRVSDVNGRREALRLTRLLHDLMPDEPTATALLALLLLTEARAGARIDAAGEVVALPDQDRTRWDRPALHEGLRLLNESLRRTAGRADGYQLQAAIAGEHARAASWAATDWPEVVRLYDLLLDVHDTPGVRMARAVALAERDGAEVALAALSGLPPDHRLLAVRAELLHRTGRDDEALEALELSLDAALSAPERRHRLRQLDAWRAGRASEPGRSGRYSR